MRFPENGPLWNGLENFFNKFPKNYKKPLALKECYESEYWLELLNRTGYIPDEQYKPLQSDCGAIRRMLIASINTTKSNHQS